MSSNLVYTSPDTSPSLVGEVDIDAPVVRWSPTEAQRETYYAAKRAQEVRGAAQNLRMKALREERRAAKAADREYLTMLQAEADQEDMAAALFDGQF